MAKIGRAGVKNRNKIHIFTGKKAENFQFISRCLAMAFAFFFGVFVFAGILYACPGCTDLTKFGRDTAQTMRFGSGIAWSMLLMFAVPFILVGGIALAILQAGRRVVKTQEQNSNS